MEQENTGEKKQTHFNIEEIEHKGQKIFIEKRIDGGYRLIYPIVKDINKSFWEKGNKNWKNFLLSEGSYLKTFFLFLIIGIIIFSLWAYKHDVQACTDLIRRYNTNPESVCVMYGSSNFGNFPVNLSNISWGLDVIDEKGG